MNYKGISPDLGTSHGSPNNRLRKMRGPDLWSIASQTCPADESLQWFLLGSECAHIGSMTWTTGIPELDSALVMLSLCPKALVCSRNGSVNVWGGERTRNQWRRCKWKSSVGMKFIEFVGFLLSLRSGARLSTAKPAFIPKE